MLLDFSAARAFDYLYNLTPHTVKEFIQNFMGNYYAIFSRNISVYVHDAVIDIITLLKKNIILIERLFRSLAAFTIHNVNGKQGMGNNRDTLCIGVRLLMEAFSKNSNVSLNYSSGQQENIL
jgi:hypothetical protein